MIKTDLIKRLENMAECYHRSAQIFNKKKDLKSAFMAGKHLGKGLAYLDWAEYLKTGKFNIRAL